MKCSVISLGRAIPYVPVCGRDIYKDITLGVSGEIVLKAGNVSLRISQAEKESRNTHTHANTHTGMGYIF